MSLLSFYNGAALLAFFGALLLSVLLYLKNIKGKLIPIANLCSLLVFLYSLVLIVYVLGEGLNDPAVLGNKIAVSILVNLYAGLFNAAARVWVRVTELIGNKRLRIKVSAEIVER